MGKGVRMIWQTLKVFILFTGSTILFYYGIMWIGEEYEGYHRYDEPEGSAVKVSSAVADEEAHWYDRLLFFYTNGE
ncbi:MULTISPECIES: YqzK family protein [Rossellomorea]|jgi:hypothetical protein|uniref:DUF4227 family protein n=1 Tax=Rossellomorea marisflavi TaxID=189381 RepID=A0A0J5SEM2_9BACI|nr:YqzK family protein [Rossellomorea marisflavi]KQU59719.1 hypothetical protein ASG66_08375 [Bacillus sp. Leaf406]MBV6683677.1 YqzK family protein [Bacillus sp. JRC01]VXB36737.1 conserved hypothetical protein [Bacillus sp. 349Y]KMK93662.1 membrane protein [Rossellomorea marisflavi]KML01400.1 membrane protein [Rossellomorea marisflavi]